MHIFSEAAYFIVSMIVIPRIARMNLVSCKLHAILNGIFCIVHSYEVPRYYFSIDIYFVYFAHLLRVLIVSNFYVAETA